MRKKLSELRMNEELKGLGMAGVCSIILLICLGIAGSYYLKFLRKNMLELSASSVLSATEQHRQAFDTFIYNDMERLDSHVDYFSRYKSTDEDKIRELLGLFSKVEAYYTLINLENANYYNNKNSGETQTKQLSDAKMETYRALEGSGVRGLFQSIYSDGPRFGYYETFTFADGVSAVYQKSYDSTKVSREFSLSFYNGEGLGYVVTEEGDILLRSINGTEADNIFDMLADSYGVSEIDNLVLKSSGQDSGSAVFNGLKGSYIFAFAPIESVKGWYMVSVVPTAAVTKRESYTIINVQFWMICLGVLLLCFLCFFLTAYLNQRRVRKKEQEILYRQERFDVFSTYLSDNTDEAYILLGADAHKVEYVSPNVERVLGIPESEIKGDIRTLGDIKYIQGEKVSFEMLENMAQDTCIGGLLTERSNPETGELRWFRESVYRVHLQDENKFIVFIADRTQEKKMQEALNDTLEIAQEANKAKSNFLSNVSHDIRTPMNAIMGLVSLLKEEADNPEQVREYTRRIDSASQHLLWLINDVLDINKIESNKATLNITELCLPQIIDELNTIIRPQIKAKNQIFEIYATAFSHEHLLGDKLRINQVLINILSNAVKYTQPGGRIELRVEELPRNIEGYSHIQFTIRDNGQGMSEEYLKVIFEPFSREKNARTDKIQGTGLGMAITKRLVDLMGGTISVESKEGGGSTFIVELELRNEENEEDDTFWERHRLNKMLVVDDEEDICHHVIKTMGKTNVVVDYALDGEKALHMIHTADAEGAPYDLIVLDWKMPVMNGAEVARQIRDSYSANIPIILFTAYDWSEIQEELKGLDVEYYLPKPFFIYTFKETVARIMAKKEPVTEAEETPAPEDNPLKGRHVLLVDDVDVNRLIMSKILQSQGATCDVAENGEEAVEKFGASAPGTYDMIFMDVQMPVMDGYEATKTIRESMHPDAESIVIIAMTANAFVEDVRDTLAVGMNAHVSKPVILEQLKATVKEVMLKKEK